jgi:hypothetical protein
MARSKRKTTVAVLREILGLDGQQDYFATLIGKSPSWVRHASCGLLSLTREAAYQIAFATGVSPEWLLAGDVGKPPITSDHSSPYSRNAFLEYQTKKKSSFPELTDPLAEAATKEIPKSLLKILSAIHASGDVSWRLRENLESLEGFANHFDPENQVPHSGDGNRSFNPREAAFIRSVLRSTQAHLKNSKSSKIGPSFPNEGGEMARKQGNI